MNQLEPGPGEGVFELFRVLEPARGDLAIGRVDPQGDVGGEHHGRMPLVGIMGIRHQVGRSAAGRLPLGCTPGALGQFPLEAVQVLQEVVGPGRRVARPGAFQATGDGVAAIAFAVLVLPTESLGFDIAGLRLDTDVLGRIGGAMGLAEGMAAGNQRSRLFIVHPHATESLPDGMSSRLRIGLAARALGIHVDQAHLGGAQRRMQLPVLVAPIEGEPLALGSPVHVFGVPGIDPTAGEAQGLEAHGLHGHVTRQDQQVGPGDLAAVLLLDRPEQARRLVQVGVVGPTVERRQALQSAVAAAPSVDGSIGAGAVPGHANEKRPVVAIVGRPPVLGSRHQLGEIRLQGLQVETLEPLGIVEAVAGRTGFPRRLAQGFEAQPVGPPVVIVRRLFLGACQAERRDRRDPDRQQGDYGYRSFKHLSCSFGFGIHRSGLCAQEVRPGYRKPIGGPNRSALPGCCVVSPFSLCLQFIPTARFRHGGPQGSSNTVFGLRKLSSVSPQQATGCCDVSPGCAFSEKLGGLHGGYLLGNRRSHELIDARAVGLADFLNSRLQR